MEESIQDFKWLFPEERLRNTPSYRQGISPEKELTFRQKQAMLIQAIGSKAHLTQLAVKTSVVFMHRFFMYRSIIYYPRVQLAIAFALAGGKVEESETARKLEHLIRSTVEVLCANKYREFLDKSDQVTYDMDCHLKPKIAALKESRCSTDSAEYLEMRKLILECETEIYSVIGFQLQITHPHNFVLRMCKLLGAEGIKDLTQYAYNLATASSQLTMLCLKYKPETIAAMCLNVAFKANSVQLISKDSTTKWYEVYDADTDYSEIEAVSEEFLKLLKGCPLLPTWMSMLGKLGKRNLSGPVRGPAGYPVSRPPTSATVIGTKSISSQNPSAQRYSSSSAQSATDSTQNRSSHGENRTASSVSNRPPYPSSVRPQGSRNPPPSSSQMHPETQSSSSSWAQQPPHTLSSSSSNSTRTAQDNVRHMSRSGSSTDMSRSREDQSRLFSFSKLDMQANSEQDKQRLQSESYRQQEPNNQLQQNLSVPKVSEPSSSQTGLGDEGPSPNAQLLNYYSPVAVRPPSPPFPPPADFIDDIDDTGAGRNASQSNMLPNSSAGKTSSPDVADNNSSGFTSAPMAGSKLSLTAYRQRVSAKFKEKPSIPTAETLCSSQDEINTSKLDDSFTSDEMKSRSATNSPRDEKPFQSVSDYRFSKPQDSPSNPRITLKVKRDPTSGEPLSVKYADSGLKIKIKPPKPESEAETTASMLEQSTGFSTPREEGEILEDSPSPASSTGSSRRSEGLRIRLSVPKSSDSSGNKREGDHWASRRSAEHESSYRSHHHGHHYHHRHHKSKKHKEHRSSRHEGKSSSGHHSSKRQGTCSYDDRQAKLPRVSDSNTNYASGAGNMGRDIGAPPPPPLPPLPPPPSYHTLQHQNSGFSINDAFSSSLPPDHDIIPEYGDDANLSAPSTPLEAIPPHHERFHRMLEEHRAREEAKRPPLPPVPPPPPPPTSPPPPPPPSL